MDITLQLQHILISLGILGSLFGWLFTQYSRVTKLETKVDAMKSDLADAKVNHKDITDTLKDMNKTINDINVTMAKVSTELNYLSKQTIKNED